MASRMSVLTAAVAMAMSLSASAESLFPASSNVPDPELDALRGGVMLPNGLDVAIGIDIQTRVNGELALHTVVSTEAPDGNGLRVLVDGRTREDMPAGVSVDRVGSGAPLLIIDRRGAGTTLMPSRTWASTTRVNVVNAPREVWPVYAGEQELDVEPNGPAVNTDLGRVDVDRDDAGAVVTLRNDSLLIQHLVGRTTGVVVANTANDRVIDTVSAIDVDLKGAWPLAANAMFAVNAVAAEAAVRN